MLGIFGKENIGTDRFKAPFFDGSQPCAQIDPELFFPDNSAQGAVYLKTTRPICKSCEFESLCLEYAVNTPTTLGIWAGTTERQRMQIRKTKRFIK